MKDERSKKLNLMPKLMEKHLIPDDFPNNDAERLPSLGNTSGSEIEAEFEGGHGESNNQKNVVEREMAVMTNRSSDEETVLRNDVAYEGGAKPGNHLAYASRKAITFDDDASYCSDPGEPHATEELAEDDLKPNLQFSNYAC